MFTGFTAMAVFAIMIIYMLSGRKGGHRDSPSAGGRTLGRELRGEREVRADRIVLEEFRADTAEMNGMAGMIPTGDYVDREPEGMVVYRNTMMHVEVDELRMYFTRDYDSYRLGEAIAEELRFRMPLGLIESISIELPQYENEPVYMILRRSRTKRFREMLFEFHGKNGLRLAQEASEKILKARDKEIATACN